MWLGHGVGTGSGQGWAARLARLGSRLDGRFWANFHCTFLSRRWPGPGRGCRPHDTAPRAAAESLVSIFIQTANTRVSRVLTLDTGDVNEI